ncbi:MAG: sporulation protein YabP [Syntrophomonadaceae bacterium]|nr:sporulation protein YabP [Syntrophomonadaceae bacterium]
MTAHIVQVNDRKDMDLTGITNINTFDEKEIILETVMGYLIIGGDNLHINLLKLDEGKVALAGSINSIFYKTQSPDIKTKSKNIINRLFK